MECTWGGGQGRVFLGGYSMPASAFRLEFICERGSARDCGLCFQCSAEKGMFVCSPHPYRCQFPTSSAPPFVSFYLFFSSSTLSYSPVRGVLAACLLVVGTSRCVGGRFRALLSYHCGTNNFILCGKKVVRSAWLSRQNSD